MPTYTYCCENKLDCGHEFELVHPIAECEDDHGCPVCGYLAVRILRCAPDTFFFGPGFASTEHVARPNVGRNPTNQVKGYSDGK